MPIIVSPGGMPVASEDGTAPGVSNVAELIAILSRFPDGMSVIGTFDAGRGRSSCIRVRLDRDPDWPDDPPCLLLELD